MFQCKGADSGTPKTTRRGLWWSVETSPRMHSRHYSTATCIAHCVIGSLGDSKERNFYSPFEAKSCHNWGLALHEAGAHHKQRVDIELPHHLMPGPVTTITSEPLSQPAFGSSSKILASSWATPKSEVVLLVLVMS